MYTIEQVNGDGIFGKAGQKRTEKSAAKAALSMRDEHQRCYGQALRHTTTGRTIGACRVVCPDGKILAGIDLDISANA